MKDEPIHKDYFGTELKIGDAVAFTRAGSKFHKTGIIQEFSKKKVGVIWMHGDLVMSDRPQWTQTAETIKKPD